MMEHKINGSIKDIAVLIDSYENIKEKWGIDEWDEEAFEREEKRHHVRRGFELMYRNLMDGGRVSNFDNRIHAAIWRSSTGGYD